MATSDVSTGTDAPTPAALAALSPASRMAPLVCAQAAPGATSLGELLRAAIDSAMKAGAALPLLGQHGDAIAAAVDRGIEARDGARPLDEMLDRALARLPSELDLSPAAAAALELEIASLRSRLPRGGVVIGPGPNALPELVEAVVRQARDAARERFVARVRETRSRIVARLESDRMRGPEGRTSAALAATLGRIGTEALDARALAESLPSPRGAVRLDRERQERLESSLARIDEFLENATAAPEIVLVRGETEGDALERAIERFEEAAHRAIPLVRALRVARLELADDYEAARHDTRLSGLDWRGLGPDEMLALPAVVVIEEARAVRRRALSALSSILLSGRPILVVVTEDPMDPDRGPAVHAGYHPGLGYLAVGHRETFVLQSSLGRPKHLIDGLRAMATTPGPGAAFVAVPRWDSPVPAALQLAAYWNGRGTPCFVHDPRRGATWADRFDLSDNPAVDRPWPSVRVGDTIEEPFTWAHAAALDPAWRDHFATLPKDAWTDDQVEVGTFLDADRETRRRLVPFVWTLGENGSLERTAITRELAFASADRVRSWHILQELAGRDNEYVVRAVRQAREEAAADAAREREQLLAAHVAEIERVRADTASDAMRRLAGVLLGIDAGTAPVAPTPEARAVVPAPPTPAPTPAETPVSAAPWIDSALCTSCNECTNLNGKMFRYNADKQAVLADATAGTFAQLVRAAEKCPARCIHPGQPRSGDKTATAALIARAAAFG